MHKRRIYLLLVLILAAGVVWFFPSAVNDEEEFSGTAKVALRTVGNELLLSYQDSTSRVMPVIAMESFTYQLSFEHAIGLDPSRLVSIVSENFEKANLPEQYRVELIQCQDEEVAYSYEMRFKKENTIIPCGGRVLPPSCYTIEVQFTNVKASNGHKKWKLYVLIAFSILGFLVDFFLRKKKSPEDQTSSYTAYAKIGSFQFYPEQNKLVKEATEIALSKKECELLALLAAHPNQIMKREDLTKKVWEDNGVIVGRSLDTYISKLRKKLQSDASIKITNVHGVGYKLEH